jgi:hypothetical protein
MFIISGIIFLVFYKFHYNVAKKQETEHQITERNYDMLASLSFSILIGLINSYWYLSNIDSKKLTIKQFIYPKCEYIQNITVGDLHLIIFMIFILLSSMLLYKYKDIFNSNIHFFSEILMLISMIGISTNFIIGSTQILVSDDIYKIGDTFFNITSFYFILGTFSFLLDIYNKQKINK